MKINGRKYFTESITEPEGEPKRRQVAPSPVLGVAPVLAVPRGGVGPPVAL